MISIFLKDKRKLSEPPKVLGIPNMTEKNIKTAVLESFPDNSLRKPDVRIVEVNDKASLEKVVDYGKP